MSLMDDTLIDLYVKDVISAEEVYARADQKHLVRQQLKL
jgi:Tfp pilus assembly ATPase PilU